MEEKEKELFELAISTYTREWVPEKDLVHTERFYVSTGNIEDALEELMGFDVNKTEISIWMHEHGFKLEKIDSLESFGWVVWETKSEEKEGNV